MMIIIYFLLIGAKIGWLTEPFFTGRRGELGTVTSVIVGSIASFGTGFFLLLVSGKLFSGEWLDLPSVFAAPIAAIVLNLR